MSNQNKDLAERPKFLTALNTIGYQNAIKTAITDEFKRKQFITAITSAVSANKDLQLCEPMSVLSAALLGEGLNLTPSPQLGQYYMLPFNTRDGKKASFVLGYRGYIQLAIRSGQYKKIIVTEIKKGELISHNPLTEEFEAKLIDDFEQRQEAETIGYYAMFEYMNGLQKCIYWSKQMMLNHADTYSPAFSKLGYKKLLNNEVPEKDLWRYSSFWYKNFDAMAQKTMLRQLISKWGIMSAEMQRAFEADQEPVQELMLEPPKNITPTNEPKEVSIDEI